MGAGAGAVTFAHIEKTSVSVPSREADARRLLSEAAERYNKHFDERRMTFNIFRTLSAHDRELSHSRFLHALLDHRLPDRRNKRLGTRENLENFLVTINAEIENPIARFDTKAATVEREKHRIDLLIADRASSQAVVIENKIGAGDQPQQLKRYRTRLESVGFSRVHVLYLTLDGHEPSEQSHANTEYACISYESLLPWLEQCQKGAYAEPALRESVEQYVDIVRELLGTHIWGKYMEELKPILKQTGHLSLARDLGRAANSVVVDIVDELLKSIGDAVEKQFGGELVIGKPPSGVDRIRIEKSFGMTRRHVPHWYGLYYPLNGKQQTNALAPAPSLGVELGVYNATSAYFQLGVRCLAKGGKDIGANAVDGAYEKVQAALAGLETAQGANDWWPWRRSVLGSPEIGFEQVADFVDEGSRDKLAVSVAHELHKLWKALGEKAPELLR